MANPNHYERVTFRPEGGRSQTVILNVTSDSKQFLCGWEVKEDGEEVQPDAKHDRRLHMLDKSLVRKRTLLKMNKHYGLLEVPDPEHPEWYPGGGIGK